MASDSVQRLESALRSQPGSYGRTSITARLFYLRRDPLSGESLGDVGDRRNDVREESWPRSERPSVEALRLPANLTVNTVVAIGRSLWSVVDSRHSESFAQTGGVS